jgi:pantoate--beta-alanine ligase
MNIATTVAAVRGQVRAFREAGETVALVPTMGYLHEGHLTLVRTARRNADRVVVSIFVNPTQFGPSEDLERYPRDEAGDRAKLESVGTDVLFMPTPAEMYPRGFQTWVTLDALPGHLCGISRPVHFRGVATVCTKLFNIVTPDVAVFGEKDYQQLLVIRRMVEDLDQPLRIVGAPIVREPDGLAMSSRNAYLTADQRARAVAIVRALDEAEALVSAGERDAAAVRNGIEDAIAASGGRPDYVSIVDPVTLDEVSQIEGPVQAAVAAFYGATRLIDNRRISP